MCRGASFLTSDSELSPYYENRLIKYQFPKRANIRSYFAVHCSMPQRGERIPQRLIHLSIFTRHLKVLSSFGSLR